MVLLIALSVPEVLDNVLSLAGPAAQAVAAQTCQYWSNYSLPWLWRDMKSYFPILELLSELEYKNNTWEFTSELFDANWERFNRYAGYVRSVHFDQALQFRGRRALPSDRTLAYIFLHRPAFEGSMFPKLSSVQWNVEDGRALVQLLLFLVPTITILKISCRALLEDKCISVLRVLAPRNILLTKLEITMPTHTHAFLKGLPDILAGQKRLRSVGLPNYSASQGVVAALSVLPLLEEYEIWSFVEYQNHLGIGMDFDWEQGDFTALRSLNLTISLIDAVRVMSKPHQPRLDGFTMTSRDFLEHANLHSLCSSLPTSQPSLTVLYLTLYSGTVLPDPSSQAIPFNLIRPLLLCTELQVFCIRTDMGIAYDDDDITRMASAWSSLETLSLCADPVSHADLTTGQPLRSVGSFTQRFRALQELSIYLNSLGTDAVLGVSAGPSQSRLSVLDFGTSPVPTDSTGAPHHSKATYVASLLRRDAEIKSDRSQGHKRFLQTTTTAKEEFSRRKTFWFSFATEVYDVLSGTK
ncbi:hypothetical protein FRB98_006089 [Tulasnella sp. 332]|nr:hypothetical protein FRB98_006089 [Tulasnella sp. 332]